uniref:C2H2-type domain-containing protein n=1 Tax=Timema bartmani TaxID=61472 RepID=A0A7R9I271_9NEOP|nr:unnamed protein product [Timema bartmani]
MLVMDLFVSTSLTIIPFSSSNNQQHETRTDTRLGVPSPDDYVLMKEETFAVDSDRMILAGNALEEKTSNRTRTGTETEEITLTTLCTTSHPVRNKLSCVCRLGTQHIEACVAAVQDSDVVRALKRRREVLPPMWDVFERRSAPGKRALVTQRRYIVNKGAFPCSLCNKCFTVTQGHTRDGLGDPNDGLSGEDDASLPFATVRFFSCHVCGKVFPKRSSLKRHQRVHLELFSPGPLAPHPCPLCGKAFGRREHLSRHLASHANTRQYACDNCAKPFLRKEHLERHRLAHCRGSHEELELPESEHPTTPPPVEDPPIIDRPFPCDVCQQTFVGQDQLERHQKRMHNMTPLEGSTVKPRIHTCSVCSRVFTRKEHMVRHQKIHQREFLLGSGSFLADMTLAVPTDSAVLNNNNDDSLAETGIKLEGTSWNDDSLSKAYNGQDLNHHLDDIKSEPDESSSPTQEQVKPYQCPCCEAKTFTRRSHMVRHFKRAHSDQPLSLVVISNRTDYSRQYKEFQLSNGQHYCKFCGKTFGRRYHLVRHMKVHGSNDAPQPFHCSSCDNSFSTHDLFQSHICQEAVSKKEPDDCTPQAEKRRKTRGGYHECGVCGINFAKKKLLKRHSLTVHVVVYLFHRELRYNWLTVSFGTLCLTVSCGTPVSP